MACVVDAIAAVEPEFSYQRDLAPVVSHLRSMVERVQRAIASKVPGGHREALTVRRSGVESFPTPPAPERRPDTRTQAQTDADAAAIDAVFSRHRR